MKPISFAPWFFGMVIVSIPIIIMEQSDQSKEAWSYILAVFLGTALFYNEEVSGFIAQLTAITNGG